MTKPEIIALLKSALESYRCNNFDDYSSRLQTARDAAARLGSPSDLMGEVLLINALPEIGKPDRMILRCREALSLLKGQSQVVPEGSPMLPDKYDPFGYFWTEKGKAEETAVLLTEAEKLWKQLTGGGQGTAVLYKARLAYYRGQLPESLALAEEAFLTAAKNRQEINGVCAAEILVLLSRHGLLSCHTDDSLSYVRRICGEGADRASIQAAQITRNNIYLSLGILNEIPDWIRDGDFGAASCPQPPGWYMLEDKLAPSLLSCAMLSRMQYLTYAEKYLEALALADTAQICYRISHPITDIYFYHWRSVCYEALGDISRARDCMRVVLTGCASDSLWLIPGEYEPSLPALEKLAAAEYGEATAKRLRQIGQGMRNRIMPLRKAYFQAGLPVCLTTREREVLELIGSGLTNAQAARSLGIGVETVKSHLKHAYEKLGVNRRTQIVRALGSTREAATAPWAR